jgi:hypothetical protein
MTVSQSLTLAVFLSPLQLPLMTNAEHITHTEPCDVSASVAWGGARVCACGKKKNGEQCCFVACMCMINYCTLFVLLHEPHDPGPHLLNPFFAREK